MDEAARARLEHEALKALHACRASLLGTHGFIATLAMQLELRTNAIRPRHQDRVLIAKSTERQETSKTAMRIDDTGANRRANGTLKALDDSVGGLE